MGESIAPWALLCRRGCVPVDSPAAAVFLKSSPPGAYTTTGSGNDGECLLLWDRHLKRSAHSMEVLSSAMPDRFPRPLGSCSRLQDLVRPPLQMLNLGVEVQTTALGDGVLPGVIRQLVIEVCEEDEIPTREVMPPWQSRETWIEAFVTSGLRIVQPVESIRRCHPWVREIDWSFWRTASERKFDCECHRAHTQPLWGACIGRGSPSIRIS